MYYLKNSVSPYYASIIFSNNLPMLALVSIPLPFLTSWSPLSQPHFHLSTLSSLVFRSLLSSTSTPQSIIIIPPLWISSIICPFHHHYLSKLQSQLKIIIWILCVWAQSDKCCWRKKNHITKLTDFTTYSWSQTSTVHSTMPILWKLPLQAFQPAKMTTSYLLLKPTSFSPHSELFPYLNISFKKKSI